MYLLKFTLSVLSILQLYSQVQSLESENIIGGTVKPIEAHPYTALVSVVDNLICTGAFISVKHVISAVHCIFKSETLQLTGNTVEITAGVSNVLKDPPRFFSKAKKAYLPKRFHYITDDITTEDDIVVFLLDQSIPPNSPYVQTIALPERFAPIEYHYCSGEKVYFSSFGDTTVISQTVLPDGSLDIITRTDGNLHVANARVLSPSECSNLRRDGALDEKKILCAQLYQHDRERPEGTCNGDSGGPLVAEFGNEKVLIGILAQALVDCNEKLMPGLYTRVAIYREFIENSIKGTSYPSMMVLDYENKSSCQMIYV